MQCPKCRLFNPPEAQRCDCGFDFESASMQRSFLNPENPRQHALLTPGRTTLLTIVAIGLLILLRIMVRVMAPAPN